MTNHIRSGSKAVDLIERGRDWLSSITDRSTTVGERIVSGSVLYQWLTAEPESEGIVIDLGETVSLGPIIELIDRLPEIAHESTVVAAVRSGAQTSLVVSSVRQNAAALREQPLNAISLAVAAGAISVLLFGGLLQALSVLSTAVLLLLAIVGMGGLGSEMTLGELRETRSVQLLVSAFERPEPPASDPSELADADRGTDEDDMERTATDDT